MTVPAAPGDSKSYLPRLATMTFVSMAQLVRSPSEAHRGEAARRLLRQWLLTAALGVTSAIVLMIWFDAREIALMPPRNSAELGPARFLTNFGKDSYVLLALGAMFLAVMLAAAAVREPLRHRLMIVVVRFQFVFLAVAVPLAVGELVKWVAGRGRPFVGGKANAFNFEPFAGSEAYASLPSAHAVTAFALAFAVAALWPGARGAMLAYALVIAATRLVLLAHHPSDVVAGATIAVMGALWVRYWFARRGLGFSLGEGGMISPVAALPLKGVAAGASAP